MLHCMNIADLQLMAFLPPSTLDALLYFQTITLPRSNIGDGYYFRKQAAHNLTVCQLRGADDQITADQTPSRVSNQSLVFNSRRFYATALCLLLIYLNVWAGIKDYLLLIPITLPPREGCIVIQLLKSTQYGKSNKGTKFGDNKSSCYHPSLKKISTSFSQSSRLFLPCYMSNCIHVFLCM